MECPNCKSTLPSRQCPECEKQIPVYGKFCCYCGAALAADERPQAPDTDTYDFSERVLCSDGTCIGVINEQGVCSECGKPYSGEPE